MYSNLKTLMNIYLTANKYLLFMIKFPTFIFVFTLIDSEINIFH